jgi:regulator of protease activity HflC (stomatin/prohibitin superfamily)
MELDVETTLILATIVASASAVLLAYLIDRKLFNAVAVGGATAAACGLCVLGMHVGNWIGLLIAILLVAFMAYRLGRSLGKQRGALFLPALWLGFCTSCAVGIWAGGAIGLLIVTLPSLAVFWGTLYGISRNLLPIAENGQAGSAFRALLTYSLGTNYPYYVVEDHEPVERASGNPYQRYFSGPGIVLTDAAHAPIIWDGLKFRRVSEPGLSFTERFETIYQVVDLRPQLRSFHVEAVTKDGIRVRVETSIPFKLRAGSAKPHLGSAFPFDAASIFRAAWKQPVEQGQQRAWDEIVPIAATRLLRKIIGQYDLDDLCARFDPVQDPRREIETALMRELRRQVRDSGIEVIGGRIGNLAPVNGGIIDRRIDAWRADWERHIMETVGEGQANAIFELERAHTQAQASLISAIRDIVKKRPEIDPEVLTKMAALRFVEALEETASSPQVREALPSDATETIDYLRRALA